MGWNKNTIVASAIDFTIDTLKNLGVPYTLTTLGEVNGDGLNDDYFGTGKYPIRRLEYLDKIILEQMERTYDCDFDDHLKSSQFAKDQEPKSWPLELYLHDEGYCPGDEPKCSCKQS